MEDVLIRKVSPEEISILLEVAQTTFVAAFGSQNTKADMDHYIQEKLNLDQLTKEFGHPNSEFYFACLTEDVIGYLKVNVGDAQTEEISDALEIERIYVRSDFQGMHVGKLLLNYGLKVAGERSLAIVWLGVWDQNARAIKFYERNDFKKFGSHSFYLGSDKQTDILMRLKLS